jgi:hypothetical protein
MVAIALSHDLDKPSPVTPGAGKGRGDKLVMLAFSGKMVESDRIVHLKVAIAPIHLFSTSIY